MNISGLDDGSYLNSWTTNGETNEKWSLNYISAGVYEIVNSRTGMIITNDNGLAVLSADTDGANQRWNIVGVETDFDGYYLYYKIVSNADSTVALTFNQNSNSISAETYTGDIYQKFKLNLDGIEGFAADCTVDEGEKAGTIGGLLGETVTASTADELEDYLDSTEPLTVVVTANIDMQNKSHTRIRDNKTIVGSYAANTISDSQFRTNDVWGAEDDEPSDNIVFRNIDFQAVNVSDRILVNIWSSRQIWIDHCSFTSSLTYDRTGNGLDEVGKFIWINTPYESYYYAKDLNRSHDYITISYCTFNNRYWTVAYGTQNGEITRCRTTLCYNYWDQNVRRCPQIGNGSAHIYNNFYEGYDSGNGSGTAQIIGGDGSDIVSENCRFQSFESISRCITAGTGDVPYRDSNSYYSASSGATPTVISFSPKVTSTWYPNEENYGYYLIDAYNTSGTDTKDFCTSYAGAFNSADKIKYITDSDMSSYVTTKYSSPFLKSITVGSDAVGTVKTGAVMDTTNKYMFKNVNSGFYLEVEDGVGADGTNVIQSDTSESTSNTWKLIDAGDGYYYVRSCTGDGKTYYLDLYYGSTANGTNIDIWSDTASDAQLFKFVDNGDGSYTITTKVTDDASCLGVSAGSIEDGANIVQWECDGTDNQKWVAEKITIKDGATLDESKCYMIKNVNSGMYLNIESGAQANGTNVQQWVAGDPSANDVWHVEYVNWGYYYIYSALGDGETWLLNVDGNGSDGVNIDINEKNGYSSQYFKFVDNEDGTYTIVTRASKDLSAVAVSDDSTDFGANILQWTINGNDSQKWIIEEVDYGLPVVTTTTTTTTTTTMTTTTTTTATTTSTEPATTTTIPTTTEPISEIYYGDIDMNGEITISDAVEILSNVSNSEKYPLNSEQLDRADVYQRGDGLSNMDALSVQKLIAQVITSLPETYNS